MRKKILKSDIKSLDYINLLSIKIFNNRNQIFIQEFLA